MPEPDVKAIFQQALDFDSAAERAAFLEATCARYPEVKKRVEALLKALGDAGSFLGSPSDATANHTPEPDADPTVEAARSVDETLGTMIGPYKLLQKIGEGGMGSVFMAEQEKPVRRKVALKVIKAGMDTAQVVARFEAERQALAIMDHQNIARVLDAGATGAGRPFFVMELVKGVPITEYCDQNHLSPKERLALFIPVCQAIQHAHQKGIIHRDIKPTNVLVTLYDGKPVPKVIDFGVAKAIEQRLTERTMFTQHGAVVGTLEYMSPEQAGMSALDVDTRSDVYSLGVLLYELLTGSTPLQRAELRKAAYSEILRRIREEEPPKPSTRLSTTEELPSIAARRKTEPPARLSRLMRGELDWIVMKALEKDRTRRYETATGFAKDIQRYLDGDPVEAGPPSAAYKLKKFMRKHRAALVTAGAFAILLVVATAVSIGLALWADRERKRAENHESIAIDAVNRFRDAVVDEPELKNTPALAHLRKRLLKEPLAFFRALRDRLQSNRDTRPESLVRLAQVSFNLGNLTRQIGDKQDALIAYRESLAIWQKLVDANPAVTEFQNGLALSHNNIGNILGETGELAGALKSHELALEIRRKLADANPAVGEFQDGVAQSYNNIGSALDDVRKPAEALKAYRLTLAILQKLVDANPAVADYRRGLAGSHYNIGNLLRDTGELAEALKSYEQALEIRRKLADVHPTVADFQGDLADIYTAIAGLWITTGKPGEAMKALESALAIEKKLADANPTVIKLQGNLALDYNNMGALLNDTGKPGEAMKAHESALVIFQKLADANPTVTEIQNGLATSHNNIGRQLSATGKPAEALRAYESALAIRRKMANANPADVNLQCGLADSYKIIGVLLNDAGKPAEALGSYESALAIYQKLAGTDPTDMRIRRGLADSHNNAAIVLGETGKPAEALKAHESALKIRRELAREHPERPDLASDLGGCLNNIAIIDLGARRFEEAGILLREAVEWQRKALATNPANPIYREFLANHLINLIAASRGLGDSEGAADAERELVKLQDSDPAMTALDEQLAALIRGEQQPKDKSNRLRLAQRAYNKGLHATAARLWSEVLTAEPTLGDDRQAQHRYNAACAAALAGSGRGKEEPAPDEAARAKLRRQALEWLKAELSAWKRVAMTIGPGNKKTVAATLKHWTEDADLAGIRDEKELAKLSEVERVAFQRFWTDVGALLAKTAGRK